MRKNTSRAVRLVCLLLIGAIGLGAELPVYADAIALSVGKGPGPNGVTLGWTGGTAPYKVFRGTTAVSVLNPPNLIATTASSSHADTPPAAALTMYNVIAPGPPEIRSITPRGASFGTLIAIYGQNFGSDPADVVVRFSYTDVPSGDNLTVDQAVFTASDTRIDVAVPMAVPNRVNQVSVVVAGVPSPPVPYLVGALPVDPTPGVAGDQTLELVDALDELVVAFDGKLDAWYVQTGVLNIFQIGAFHSDTAQISDALAQLRSFVATASPNDLSVTDCLVATPAFQQALQRLRDAKEALHGSPLGSIMCEGRDVRDVIRDVIDILNILDEILSTVQSALNTACGIATIAAIFTGGAASPIALFLCTVAGIASELLGPIIEAIQQTSYALDAIADAAPVDPMGTIHTSLRHPLWGGPPTVVYVQGSIPVEGRVTQDFHNGSCNPNGCLRTFTITIFLIDIDIDISIPHIVVPDLPMTCAIDPVNSPGYTDLGTIDDGSLCRFTGADAGSGWERGVFNVFFTSTCGDETLGPIGHSIPLVSGPKLTSVTPSSSQLRGQVEMFGLYMPPNASGAFAKAQASFGDVSQFMRETETDHYTFDVPDTNNVAGTIGLRIQGRDADQILPFNVLPPVLTFARIDPGFEGEEVELHGTGFATNPVNNALTLSATPVPVVRSEPFGLVFTIPPGANTGNLQLIAATHVSNTLPFGVRRWGTAPGIALSHPGRNASNPVLAARGNSVTGVAWIDRHVDGGEVRLLFTDAAPADSGFRTPVVIAPTTPGTELSGPPSAPQKPDVALGSDNRFHVAWTNRAGQVLVSSFAKGAPPSGGVVAITPAVGTALRDPAIAVMADGTVHVAATQIPEDGGLENTLLHAISSDGGATFGAPEPFGFAGVGTPSDQLHKGEVDLTYAQGQLWRAWTQFGYSFDPSYGDTYAREIYTQVSPDGTTWSTPEPAGAGKIDVPHSGAPTASRNAPSVSGDGTGAVVAWDTATSTAYNPSGPTETYSSREIQVNGAPYDPAQIGVVTPHQAGPQSDVGRASLIHHTPGGFPMTAIASVRRIPGTSPDGLPGVPRVHVRRFPLRDLSNPTLFETTPTVIAGDTITEDSSPSFAVDAVHEYHLAWLQGPEGHRVVRYQTTRTIAWPDTLPDNPAKVAAPPRDVIAVNMGADVVGGNSLFHSGVLFVDPSRPEETRWTGVAPIPTQAGQQGRPSLSPEGRLVYHGHGNPYGAGACSLDGRAGLAAVDDPGNGVYLSRLAFPQSAGGGKSFGLMLFKGLVMRGPGEASYTPLPGVAPSMSWDSYLVSPDGRYVAFFDGKHALNLYDTVTSTTSQPSIMLDVYDLPAWSPDSTKLVYPRLAPCSFDNQFNCIQAIEWFPATDTTGATLAEAQEVSELGYGPGGASIVYRCSGLGCCDPAATPGDAAICTSNGWSVPRTPGMLDESPAIAPDGSGLAFVRTDPVDGLGRLMIWHPGDPQPSALTGPVLGLREYPLYRHLITWTRVAQ